MKIKTGKYKKQFFLIMVGLSTIIILSWRLAFIPTFDTLAQVREVQQQLSVLENAPREISELNLELKSIDNVIGKTSGNIKQEDIVDEVSEYINQKKSIELCAIPPAHVYKKENYWVKTYSLELQGKFSDLVLFLNHLEQKKNIGKISSVSYFLIKDYKTKKNSLRLKVYIQSFTKAT